MSTPSFVKRLWSTVEFKLVLAWLLVVVLTAALDPNHTYWNDFVIVAKECFNCVKTLVTQGEFVFTLPENGSAELILRNTVLLGFFGLGCAIIIISGGIDLSSGSVIALSATVFGSLMILLDPDGVQKGEISRVSVCLAIGGTLVVGAMIGTLHAWLITRIGLPPFVATLATLVGLRSFGRGLTPMVTANKSQIEFSDGALRDMLKHVPTITCVFIVFALILWFLMSRTVTGRHLHAMGGNEQAAKLSGIRTDRLKWLAYVIGSLSASIVGIISFADLGSAKPDTMARGYELNAIAASVIGGCSLQGGVGTITGTILGCLFLRTVIDAVTKVVGSGADVYEGMIVGIVVVFAVTFSQRGQKSITTRFFNNAIGWFTIPVLSLLAGLLVLLFFGKQSWYVPSYAVMAGLVVGAVLSARAVWEVYSDKKI